MLPRSYKSTMRSCRKQNKERYESMQPYMIETVDITKRFPGTLANDHICLRARAGEIMGLVGENGAGKSTILKCLNGVYPSDSYEGKILIEGKEVQLNSPLDAIRLGIGFVPQEINVLQDMNVAENIFLFDLRNGGQEKLVNHKQLRLRTKQLLEKTGIDLDPSANVRRLSIGQQQMLMIARALATDPKILILDEPTTSLSGQDVQSLFKVMRVLKEKGVAIIFVTHKLAEIMEMTDCLTVMRDGKNVGSYTRDEYDQNKIVEDMIGRKLTVMYLERACSIVNAFLVVKIGMSSFIATMGTLYICGGLRYLVNGGTVMTLPTEMRSFSQATPLGISWFFWIVLAIYAIVAFLQRKTAFGRYFYAVGNNADVSQLQGVNVKRVKVAAYLISGVLSAAAGVMATIDINSAQPSTGTNWEFKAVAACVVGGASLTGGVGNAVGVGLGIFVVFVINNIINMIGLSNYWADVFTGCILAGAVMIDIIRQRQKIHA